jgi:rare lipoprotein A (peptidoglycan hydrolase)
MRGTWILFGAAFAAGIAFGGLRLDLERPSVPVPMPRPEAATVPDRVGYREVGRASWYGPGFQGRETASGEVFDQNRLTAAHRRLPLGTRITVTNLENGKSVRVAVNDRGPYVHGRVLDLSKAAARRLGMVTDGVVRVRIEATRQELAAVDNGRRRGSLN